MSGHKDLQKYSVTLYLKDGATETHYRRGFSMPDLAAGIFSPQTSDFIRNATTAIRVDIKRKDNLL